MKEFLSNLLLARDTESISVFLDIPIASAESASRNFREVAENLYKQIRIEPFKFAELTAEIETHKNFFVGKLIKECASKYKQT